MPLGRLLIAVVAILLLAGHAWPEPGTPPGDELKAEQLDYADLPGKDGRFAATEVTVSHTPVRFYVRGTDVSAPFSVQVIAAATARPLDVTLHRQSWGKAVQSGTTGSDGSFVFEGRAYGDVGVQLASPDGAPARATIVFWQGTPAPPNMAQVYVHPDMTGVPGSSAGSRLLPTDGEGAFILYVIAGLLAVIVVFLGIVLLRRGKGGTAAALLIGGLVMADIQAPAPAFAQGEGVPNPFTAEKPEPTRSPRPNDKDVTAGKPDEGPNPFDVDKPPPETDRDKNKDATAGKPDDTMAEGTGNPFTGEATTSTGRPIELKPEDFDPGNKPKENPAGPAEPGAPVDEGYAGRLAEAETRINDLNREASANRAEIERLKMLIESDRGNEPDPSNLPPMPLTCRPPAVERSGDLVMIDAWENYDACSACYAEPLSELDELLLLYERLRILYLSTSDFVSEQLLIGDQIPKPHFLLDSAWQKQKASILESLNGTKAAYDGKWEEFNGRLTLILDELGTCEANHNNNPMWRETEGRLFFQTIKASYQRTN